MKEQFLTVNEVAELLKVSEITIYRWISAGKLPTYQMGKGSPHRIAYEDIPTFLRKGGEQKPL